MTTEQLLLNAGLLLFVLATNLGTRALTTRRLLFPLVVVGVAGAIYLRDLPTSGGDGRLVLAGALSGVALGCLAGLLMRVRDMGAGRRVTRAGWAYAALWVAVVGGRVAFAYSATGWAARAVGEFSVRHQVTGAHAWTAAFVLMALVMVTTRVAVTALRGRPAGRGTAVVAPSTAGAVTRPAS
jgi:hypothetical protein